MAECIDRGTAIAKLTALEVTEQNATMVDAKRVLADIPAADVVPVVHGRWIHDGRRIEGGIDWCHLTFARAQTTVLTAGRRWTEVTAMRLIDADEALRLFGEEYEETKELIHNGETHLDNLAE